VITTRDYDEAEWAAVTAQLVECGLLTSDGALTDDGRALKRDIEYRTDAAALPSLDVLSDDEVETLFQALTPIARQVVSGGDLPAITPMALQHSDLEDPSARLG
ncbi:MAG: helix-turn-helix domain-containing protein, partial [Mycobacterium sp.]